MDEALKKQLMSELGKASAEKRKKEDPEYFRTVQVKGVGARQKKSGRFEMITHKSGNETVEHKKGWNCGLASCTEDKTVQSDKAVKSHRTVKKTERVKSEEKPIKPKKNFYYEP